MAVVVVAQSIGGNVRFRDYRFIRMRTVGPSSLLQDVCPCKVCEKLSHAVYLVPLCSSCTEYIVINFVQFVCFACSINVVLPLIIVSYVNRWLCRRKGSRQKVSGYLVCVAGLF